MSVLARLDEAQRLAAAAAAAIFLAMFLPWYKQRSVAVIDGQIRESSDNLTAVGNISFIELTILLVAGAVIALIVLRARGATFALPGGDGTVIAAAGAWVALLLFIRLLDPPEGASSPGLDVDINVQWGLFVAFLAAGALCAAGLRLRATAPDAAT